ncbi:MAG TPA: response regulator transcription factor [Polyangia bacterium]|nr:response regulator transcription factor [Polyangia bacterium]
MRVVILDHKLFTMGLRLTLETFGDCEVVGEANTARAAFNVVRTLAPEVVVVDTVLRGLRTGNAIRKIRACAPGVRVLVLTEHGSIRDVAMAMAAGATGFALKGDSIDEILRAVQRVHLGRLYLSPSLDAGRETGPALRRPAPFQEMSV